MDLRCARNTTARICVLNEWKVIDEYMNDFENLCDMVWLSAGPLKSREFDSSKNVLKCFSVGTLPKGTRRDHASCISWSDED